MERHLELVRGIEFMLKYYLLLSILTISIILGIYNGDQYWDIGIKILLILLIVLQMLRQARE